MAADVETVPPKPRSPPKHPDFCGRRRLQLEVQVLNREVGFIEQEELQSLEGLQPVSRCCKEVNEFVGTNPDPLIPLNKKRHASCKFWRWIGSKLCCGFSWIRCCPSCNGCPQLKNSCCSHQCNCLSYCFRQCSNGCPNISCSCSKSSCCNWTYCCCPWTFSCCRLPKYFNCSVASCCKMPKCCYTCCPSTISCPEYSCGCVLDCPKCTEVHLCPNCSKPCCVSGCLC